MDRPIDPRTRHRRILVRSSLSVVGVTVAVILLFWVGELVRPSVQRSRIRTATVDRGPVEATVTASGTVVPAFERVMTSPVSSRVLAILVRPGDTVEPGQRVVELDLGETRLALTRLDDRIALKRLQRAKARQELEARLGEWQGQREIKALELRSREFEADRCRRHQVSGLFSHDELREAENDAERARIELAQIERTMTNAEQALRLRLDELDLELGILTKERDEAAHRLELASATADRAGVVTWLVPAVGGAVSQGDELARVADLSAFRVEATVSDVHSSRLNPGQQAIISSGDTTLRGTVSNVLPTVDNGIITLEVVLDKPDHPLLRHNLRVDVHIVTAHEPDTARVARGSYVNVDGRPAVFVVRGERAVRTPVRFGITSFDQYQVLEGLDPGDEVIVSDMSHRAHATEVRLR